MRYFLSILVFGFAFFISGCKKDSLCNCTESTGGTSTEVRSVNEFTQIELYNNVDLILHIDTFYRVNITAGSHLMDGVTSDVENGILQLRNKNKCNWLRSYSNKFVADVWIKKESLTHLSIHDASGNIDFADTLKIAEFRLDNWSSTGDYHLKLNCNSATLALHTGPADIVAVGHVGVSYIYSTGYGKMDLLNLNSDDVYVTNNSTDDLYINANKRIGAEIGYIANIYYTGNPSQVDAKITNTGKLIHIN